MKKTALIITGIAIIILVLLVWVYVLIFGTPKSTDDVFADLGLNSEDTAPIVEGENTQGGGVPLSDTVSVKEEGLSQLTTTPVAGFVSLDDGERVRFAERGTGHLFDLDLNSGQVTRVSQTTTPRTTEAVFSPDGSHVILIQEEGYDQYATIGELSTSTGTVMDFEGISLPTNAHSFVFTLPDTVRFLTTTPRGTTLYRYSVSREALDVLGQFPIRELTLLPGDSSGTHLYPKPTRLYQGGLYRISSNDVLSPVGARHYGFAALKAHDMVAHTLTENGYLISKSFPIDGVGDVMPLSAVVIPEKCATSDEEEFMYCGNPLGTPSDTYLEDWYKGIVQSSDYLWEVDMESGSALMLSDLEGESGRLIDVTNLAVTNTGDRLFFINKNDGTLWVFSTDS